MSDGGLFRFEREIQSPTGINDLPSVLIVSPTDTPAGDVSRHPLIPHDSHIGLLRTRVVLSVVFLQLFKVSEKGVFGSHPWLK